MPVIHEGCPLSGCLSPAPLQVPILNALGVQAAAVGNHDCELVGYQSLRAALSSVGSCHPSAMLAFLRCCPCALMNRTPSPRPPPAVDFGIPTLQKHMQSFRFPWLLSNVLDAHTGKPLGGAERSRMVTWQGVKVGLMGLVEREVGPAAAWSSRLFVPSALYS